MDSDLRNDWCHKAPDVPPTKVVSMLLGTQNGLIHKMT